MPGILIRVRQNAALGVSALFLMYGASVRAVPWDYGPNPNEYADYGHVINGYTGAQMNYNDGTNGVAPIDRNGGFCGPTSVANSLQFLANKYGGTYEDLIDGTAEDTRNDIVDLETLSYNPGMPANPGPPPTPAVPPSYDSPANNSTIWNSKVEYINSHIDPSMINIEGVINNSVYTDEESDYLDSDTNGKYNNADLTFTNGGDFDWEAFLQKQIEDGQDVEIAFSGTNIGGDENLAADQVCHMVTLMNIDSTNHYLEFVDPNNDQLPDGINAQFTINSATGEMTFTWDNDANAAAVVTINEAWAESPFPEPGAICVALTLLAGLAVHRKRRPSAV